MLEQQMWMVADGCNLSCTYCYFETGEYGYVPNRVTAADFDRWLRSCAALGPVRSVALTGGEPLLRPDLPDLVDAAAATAESVRVFTNAVMVTDEIAEGLARAGCAADVSIDRLDTHQGDRVRGGTKATIAGIERLDSAGVGLQIVMVVTSENWREIEPVARRAQERGWGLELLLVSVPDAHPLSVHSLAAEEKGELLDTVAEWRGTFRSRVYYERFRHIVRTGRVPRVRSCAAGEGGVFVNSDGAVWVCAHRGRARLGNVLGSAPSEVADAKRRALAAEPAGPCAGSGCLSLT